jgi:hypothetical protein
MSDPQGLVSYPGLTTFTRAEYVLSHGIAPGICTIEMPQELVTNLASTGDLTLYYADQYVTLKNCLVDLGNVQAGIDGYHAIVQILDRRWAWRPQSGGNDVCGHFNLPALPPPVGEDSATAAQLQNPLPGTIMPGTEQTPQQLATALLNIMGEQNFDVSQLPNDARPEVHWSWANPGQSLEDLCNSLGCRVVLWIPDNTVHLVQIGVGNNLPDGPVQWVSFGVNPPELPDSLMLVGGVTVYQALLQLEPLVVDVDGSIKTINDPNLSYAPNDGWSSTNPYLLPGFTDPALSLAQDTLYRLWRPIVPFTAPDGTMVTDASQFVLYDRQVDTHQNMATQLGANTKRPTIYGTFDPALAQGTDTSKIFGTPYKGGISVLQDWGMIRTEDPLAYVDAQGNYHPANIWIKISFAIRDPHTFEPDRYTKKLPLNSGSGTGYAVVLREEVALTVSGVYAATNNGPTAADNGQGYQLTGQLTNNDQGQLDQQADYYLAATASQYITVFSLDVPYAGLVPIQVDGLIQQVTYSIVSGPGGSTLTRASLNTEHSKYIPKYKIRTNLRKIEKPLPPGPSARKTDTVIPNAGQNFFDQ